MAYFKSVGMRSVKECSKENRSEIEELTLAFIERGGKITVGEAKEAPIKLYKAKTKMQEFQR